MFLKFAPRALWNPIRRPRVNAIPTVKRVVRAAAKPHAHGTGGRRLASNLPVAPISAPVKPAPARETSIVIEQPGVKITVTVR